ncbi:hypothetical protein PR003_g1783 [Phytophthora rubi]|uniref:HAT C-terminal dimerisation domain-containing protein n=1 Tax=Phytophthora rubi TaxID=129364 RepID=A0A6A4G6U8_9STRA|nr:hypothetical protein PR001_g1731 [Phytophthora rubi]KAE9357441.1 hypothetical protein PR003_g1783 [Phytophthora rubi]
MIEYTRKVNTSESRIAIALDPRAKWHLHLLVDDVNQVKQEVEEEYNEHYREAFLEQRRLASGPPSAKKKRGGELKILLKRFSNQRSEAATEHSPAEDESSSEPYGEQSIRDIQREDSSFSKELDRWLAADEGMSEMKESKDVCTWFQAVGDVYPRIKLMAQDFMAVTATSVPSEIAFSAAGLALNSRRARLGDDTVKAMRA